MKTFLIAFMIVLAMSGCTGSTAEKQKEILYVGTYSMRDSQGLYVYEFNRDSLNFKLIQTLPHLHSPSFLEIHPSGKYVFTVSGTPRSDGRRRGLLSAFAVNPEDGSLEMINQVPIYGAGYCHVNFDNEGKWVYVSNYSSGSMIVYPVLDAGSVGDSIQNFIYTGSSVNAERQNQSHIHSVMVSPDNRHVYVADLGTDKLMSYEINHESGKLSPTASPWTPTNPGAGPRHFTFHPSGPYIYVAEELSSSTSVYRRDSETGALSEIQRVSSLPEDFIGQNTNADIHTDPDGNHLYVSNRGHNSLVIYSINPEDGMLETTGYESTRGGHPHNFMMDPNGENVLVANHDSDNVVVFSRNPEDGSLTYAGTTLEIPAPICLKWLKL